MPTRLIVFAGQSNAGLHFDPTRGQAASTVFRPLLEQLTGDAVVVGSSVDGTSWTAGSAVLRAAAQPGSTAYWWDDPFDQGLAASPGPCLTASLAWITAHPERDRLSAIVWAQGEQDCFAIGGNANTASGTPGHPYEARATLAAYRTQLPRVFAHLRAALNRPDLPILIAEIGRLGSSAGGWVVDSVRRIQHEVAARMPGVEIASVTRDVGLSDSVHLDQAGYATVAERLARFAAARLSGGTPRRGPSLQRALLAEDGLRLDLDVALDGAAGLVPAASVSGIRIEDDNGPRTPSSFETSGPAALLARFAAPLVGRVTVRAGYGGGEPGAFYPRDDATPALPLRPEIRPSGVVPANAVLRAWRR